MTSTSEPSSSQDPPSTPVTTSSSNFDDIMLSPINLQYQPTLIKCKKDIRVWHVINDKDCVQFCKSQLDVSPLITF